MTALGLVDKTTASVIAKTSCFVQVLHRAVILHALDQCPEEREMFFKLSEQRMSRLTSRMSRSKNTLKSYAFFKDCSDGFLAKLRENLQEKMFLPGSDIVAEGNEGATCFILHQGTAEVYRNECLLKKYDPGSFFGEFVVLGLTDVRDATVRASSICLVEELQRDSLWAAIEEYPQEAKIFEGLVMRHLETTVHDAVYKCPFFDGIGQRIATSVALAAQQRVVAPLQWILRERMPGDAMFVLNRGTVSVYENSQELGILRAGDYMGATTMLGVHKTYPAGYRAKMMCHVVVIYRADFVKATQQVTQPKDWLKNLQEQEKEMFDSEMKNFNKQAKTTRMLERMKQNMSNVMSQGFDKETFSIGDLFTKNYDFNAEEIKQKYLSAWYTYVHHLKFSSRGSRVSQRRSLKLGIEEQKRAEEREIDDMESGRSNSAMRSNSALSGVSKINDNGMESRAQSVIPPSVGPAGDQAATNTMAVVPTTEDVWTKGVKRMVKGILRATDGTGLYSSVPSNKKGWQQDYGLFTSPGIPEAPSVPWSASVAGRKKSRPHPSRLANPLKVLIFGGTQRLPKGRGYGLVFS
eukprot:gnl/MRDRNA2_/MRDRNA2_146702_c0_seq1.p1 gnl/MRDRNA2_/MRDRNA2_146702_c0~~gnl/MRDRNA2_/MRDRNA2_146702_c0_seq1.p1  ORF type:complete len:657 (+),score=146.39 gnl/MRDRNA2_/MRDRNA2_146702_c0_seq1:239-1972(+)